MKLAILLLSIPFLHAAETVIVFDAPQTKIGWSLGASLHTVHGTFQFRSGTVKFDRTTGKASGSLVVNAVSGESGNSGRDEKMHKNILESPKFADIVFTPDRFEGKVPTEGKGTVKVHGAFQLHGVSHEITLPFELDVQRNQINVASTFKIPYVSWGLKNPSTFILRVNDNVDVDIRAVGNVLP